MNKDQYLALDYIFHELLFYDDTYIKPAKKRKKEIMKQIGEKYSIFERTHILLFIGLAIVIGLYVYMVFIYNNRSSFKFGFNLILTILAGVAVFWCIGISGDETKNSPYRQEIKQNSEIQKLDKIQKDYIDQYVYTEEQIKNNNINVINNTIDGHSKYLINPEYINYMKKHHWKF